MVMSRYPTRVPLGLGCAHTRYIFGEHPGRDSGNVGRDSGNVRSDSGNAPIRVPLGLGRAHTRYLIDY
jgi:hypothetical protein